MSDHWKSLADLLGTPALDRRGGESEADRSPPSWKAAESSQGISSKPSDNPEPKQPEPKSPEPKVAQVKPASVWGSVDFVPKVESVVEEVVKDFSSGDAAQPVTGGRGTFKPSERDDRSVSQQQEAAEKVSLVEEKNAANSNPPKRSGGWDALARLFGLSAPPPDADVPLPESKRPSESFKQSEAVRPASPPPGSMASGSNLPASKSPPRAVEPSAPAIDDLTQLGWSSPRSESKVSRDPGSRERTGRDSREGREPREGREVRDGGGRDRSARDSGARDSGARDSGTRDSQPRDSQPREYARGEEPRSDAGRDRNDRGRRGDREQSGRDVRGSETRVSRDAPREVSGETSERDVEPVRGARGSGERRSREGGPSRGDSPRGESPRNEAARGESPRGESPRGGDSRRRPDNRQSETRQASEGRGSESRRGEPRPAPARQPEPRSFDDRFVDDDLSDVDDLSFGQPRGRVERAKPADDSWGAPLDPVADEAIEEGGVPERRGRRRRGRRRGGADRAEGSQRPDAAGRPEASDHRGTRSEAGEVRSKASGFGRPPAKDEADEFEHEEVSHSEAGVDETPAVAGGEKRGRRRRRRGGRRQESASHAPAADVDGGELDLSEGYNLPSLLADEIEESEDDAMGHSKIPTWEETIRVLVTANVEARHSPGSGGGKGSGGRHHGGGHHGGAHHGGGHQGGGQGGQGRQGGGQGGGRGRGGNRPSGGKR